MHVKTQCAGAFGLGGSIWSSIRLASPTPIGGIVLLGASEETFYTFNSSVQYTKHSKHSARYV
jgi:hypothetical protein